MRRLLLWLHASPLVVFGLALLPSPVSLAHAQKAAEETGPINGGLSILRAGDTSTRKLF